MTAKVRLVGSTKEEVAAAVRLFGEFCTFGDIRRGREGDLICYGEIQSKTSKEGPGRTSKASSRTLVRRDRKKSDPPSPKS